MSVQLHFNNFSSGELSPLLNARIDFANYNKGARQLKDVLVLPQGGVTKRFGTRFIQNGLGVTDPTEIRIDILLFNDEKEFRLTFKNLSLEIYEDTVFKKQFVTPYKTAEIKDIQTAQNFNDMIIQHENYPPYVLSPNSDSTNWTFTVKAFKNSPTYDFERDYDAINFTPSAVTGSAINITSTADFWQTRHVGGLFSGNVGTARITSLTSKTVVVADVIADFKDTTLIKGKNCYIGEPVFSSTRGYGKTVNFYQGRLAYGGSKSLPYGVFMSDTFDTFNFDDSGATPSDAITILIGSEDANIIKGMIVERNLFVFTSRGAFSTPPFSSTPASPEATYFIQQDTHGITDTPPLIIDDHVLYVDRGGKIVHQLIYDVQESAYKSINISILSPQLIRNPVSGATFENPSINDGVYMLLINDDGTIAILQRIADENITAWSLATTLNGNFKQVVSKGDTVYFLVERNSQLYIEQLDFNFQTDSSVEFTFGTPETEITGLDHLNGQTIQILGDGFVRPDKHVAGGKVILDDPVTNFKGGLQITSTIVPMPAQYMTQTGNNLYENKRIKTIYLNYYQSLGIKINGNVIPDMRFGESGFDDTLELKTGIYEIPNMGGWQKEEVVTITQDAPLPFTVLGITYGVDQ